MKLFIKESKNNGYYINNYDEVVKELAELIRQFDKDRNKYQTDVYIYFDEYMNGTLETFTNVGGNSWLDDDHYVLYVDHPHYDDDNFSAFQTIQELADAIGLSTDELIEQTYAYWDLEKADYDLSDVEYSEVADYIRDNPDLSSRLDAAYSELIDDVFYEWILPKAEEAVASFTDRLEDEIWNI